jgi:hypothetical protein
MLSHGLTPPIILDTTHDQPTSLVVRQWARTFHYGHMILPPTAILTLIIYLCVLYTRRNDRAAMLGYALAAFLTVAIIPFTLAFMDNTSLALVALDEGYTRGTIVPSKTDTSPRMLVAKWGYLHLCRAVMPGIGAMVGFRVLLHELSEHAVRGVTMANPVLPIKA